MQVLLHKFNAIARSVLITLVLLTLVSKLKGQSEYSYSIDDRNGLPSNEVYRVIQDTFGYLWIGCDAGLFRYDGFNFTPFSNEQQNGKSISFLVEDKISRIWCKNFNGQIYFIERDSMHLFKDFSTLPSHTPSFTFDEQNNVLIGFNNRINCYNNKGDSIGSFSIPNVEGVESPDLMVFNTRLYSAFADAKVYLTDRTTEKTSLVDLPSELHGKRLRNSFFIHNNQLYLLSFDLQEYFFYITVVKDKYTQLISKFQLEDKTQRIHQVCSIKDKGLMLCTSYGLYNWESQLENYSPSNAKIKDASVSFTYLDKEGLLWIATLNRGLIVVPGYSIKQIGFLKETDNVTTIQRPHQNILAGCSNGRVFQIGNSSHLELFEDKNQQFLSVKKIDCDKDYYISRGKFCLIEQNTNKQFYPKISNIRDFILLKDSVLAVMPEMTVVFSKSDLKLNVEKLYLRVIKQTGGKAVIKSSNLKDAYLALNSGLFYFSNNELTEIKKNGKSIYVNDFYNNGSCVWATSLNSGLLKLVDGEIQETILFDKQSEQAFSRYISGNSKEIWFNDLTYLYQYNINDKKLKKLGIGSGINAKDINDILVFNDSVCLATKSGVLLFSTHSNLLKETTPTLKINYLQFSGRKYAADERIQLPHSAGNVIISFTGINFRSRGNFRYLYRIRELDSLWIAIPASQNAINYASLPSGDFHFELYAENENDMRSEVKTIYFSIASPYWQKWWFYVIAFLISLSILYALFWFRLRYLKKRAYLSNRLILSQLTALKAQMNPHFMYNSLNSIQDLILQKDIRSSNIYLSKFSTLMRKVLQASEHETIRISDEIELLDLYLSLEKLRYGDELIYSIKCSDEIDADLIKIPSLLIQPYVENAIKHGLLHKKGSKELSITFMKEDKLVCEVKDNGIGRKRSAEIKERSGIKYKSFAMDANQKRFDLINSIYGEKISTEIIDLNGHESGTLVRIRLPFMN